MISVKGKSQADGTFEVRFSEHNQSGTMHSVQVTVRDADGVPAAPAAGTLTIKIKTPGGGDFEDVPNNVIDLMDRSKWIAPLIGVTVEAMQFIPDSLDGDKTYDVSINSSFGYAG